MLDSTLKPCPFCGGGAEIVQQGTRRQSMIITCEDCGCTLESNEVAGLIKDYHWNQRSRADLTQLVRDYKKAVEALEAAEEFISTEAPLSGFHYKTMERIKTALELTGAHTELFKAVGDI